MKKDKVNDKKINLDKDDEKTKEATVILKETATPSQKELQAEVGSSDDSWKTITEEDVIDFSFGGDPYPLPKEAAVKAREHKFAFRWIEDSTKRLQEVTRVDAPLRWWVCNSTNTPYLIKYINPVTGAIHCKDQILIFKPYWMAEKIRELKEGVSEARLQAGTLKNHDDENASWRTGPKNAINPKTDKIIAVMDDDVE